ncbi:uncharacterized protein [Argopecten irradians]|uniref:uncharacterized protein n=1 Tax=Argopecten irradians TaxID=31199 RepID=UPI003718D98A
MGEDMLLKFTVFITFLSAALFHSTDAHRIMIYSKSLPLFYEFISESTTWSKASSVCVKSNGSLVTVNTKPKSDDMQNIMNQVYNGTDKQTFWIGLHRAPKWTWDGSNEVLKYFDWHPGEPRITDTTKRIGLSIYSITQSYNWIALSGNEKIVKPDRFNISSFYVCQTNLVNHECPFSACQSDQRHCLDHNGSCYFFAQNSLTWNLANKACKLQRLKQHLNGSRHLAFIKDEATEHAIAGFLKNPHLNGNYWLGASFQGKHWMWLSGEPFAQEDQNPFKTTPNACGAIDPNVWGWIDKACSEQHVFICEYAYQPTTTTPTTPTTIPTTTTTRTTTTKATPTTTPTATPSTTSTTTTPTTTPSTTPTTTTPTTTPSTTPTTTTPTTTPSTTTPTTTPSTTPTTTTPTTTPSTTPTTTTPTTTPSTTTPTTTPSTTPTTTTPTTTPSTTPTTTTPTTTPSTTPTTTTPTTTPSTTPQQTTPTTTPSTTTLTTTPSTTSHNNYTQLSTTPNNYYNNSINYAQNNCTHNNCIHNNSSNYTSNNSNNYTYNNSINYTYNNSINHAHNNYNHNNSINYAHNNYTYNNSINNYTYNNSINYAHKTTTQQNLQQLKQHPTKTTTTTLQQLKQLQ